MPKTYRGVRLIRNRQYPTYQLHAVMASKKTSPEDGLRLAALSTMEWLCQRLGASAPSCLTDLPTAARYSETSDSDLFSIHINAGYVIDIVSLPEQGMWTLQITEPDLGSDPGNPQQERMAVPGRIIETNIGYRVVGAQLECGFMTMISDPEGTETPAEVYRLAIVRRLIDHPDFGLKQITALNYAFESLETLRQLKELRALLRAPQNTLPCVIFAPLQQRLQMPSIADLQQGSPLLAGSELGALPFSLPKEKAPIAQPTAEESFPYDVADFSKFAVTFCRTYRLTDTLRARFAEELDIEMSSGEIVIMEPAQYGGGCRRYPYIDSEAGRVETLDRLKRDMSSYAREKHVHFGKVAFLSAARETLDERTREAIQSSLHTSEEWNQRFVSLDQQWKTAVAEKEKENEVLRERIARLGQSQQKFEEEKGEIRRNQAEEIRRYERKLEKQSETIVYLRRKVGQPGEREHGKIAQWVKENFEGRLLLHPKAVELLKEKEARAARVGLICDALDFLATDYWDRRFAQMSTEEMNTRCSEKYNRPFEVKPNSDMSIENFPLEYKVKYFLGQKKQPIDSALDYHLCVGNDCEHMLRIYFLHDDEKKLIVVGSLPNHLSTVTYS